MDNTNNKVCKEFESELWLIIDGSMDFDSNNRWEQHLSGCPKCTTALAEAKMAVDQYDGFPLDDITNSSFRKMIVNTVKSEEKSPLTRLSPSIRKNRSFVEIFGFYRLVFGGTVLAAAIAFLLITFLNEPKLPEINKTVSKNLLDWNALEINNRLTNVEDQIISLQTNDWDIYIVRKNKKEEWHKAISAIQKQIRKMRKEVVSTSM